MIVDKTLRLRNIVQDDGRTVIVALDHGRSRFVPNLEKPVEGIKKVRRGGADAVILSFSLLQQVYQDISDGLGLILSIPMKPSYVGLALNMEVHVVKTTFFGDIRDKVGVAPFDDISLACEEWGIPLLSEIVSADDEGRYLRE